MTARSLVSAAIRGAKPACPQIASSTWRRREAWVSVTNGSSRSAPTRTVSRCASGCSGWTASTAGSRATTRASSSGGGSVPGPSPMKAQCSVPLRDTLEQRVGLAFDQPQLDRRVLAREGADRAHDRPAGQRVHEPDGERPGEQAALRGDRLPPLEHRGQRGARVREQGLARRCQRDRAAVAQEDPLTQLGLEPADLLRDRRLGDLQPLGRAREVRLLGDRDEVGELP